MLSLKARRDKGLAFADHTNRIAKSTAMFGSMNALAL
jgi:hypothetical protein